MCLHDARLCLQAATLRVQAATLCVQVHVLSGHRGPLLCAALSTPLDLVLSGAARAPSCAGGGGLGGGEGGGGSSCIVWSAAKGRFVRLLSVESTTHAVCVSHTGSGLLVFTVCFHLLCPLYIPTYSLHTLLTLLTLSTYDLLYLLTLLTLPTLQADDPCDGCVLHLFSINGRPLCRTRLEATL